ncbi:MAG: SAM-dependent methyltransferase [Burkholderiales bacterium]|nr:SAM-dependent methyltransferase [Burkholderiales bacterium]
MTLPDDPLNAFIDSLGAALAEGSLRKATLSKYRGPEADLERVQMRRVELRGEPHLQLVYRHRTRDITKNLPMPEVPDCLRMLIGPEGFRHAQLQAADAQVELLVSQRGQFSLMRRGDRSAAPPAAPAHNREKQRWLTLDRPFLSELGVTTPQHTLVPAMARKWKQINKFVEVFSHALAASPLAGARQLRVVDFGSGKGYLTFAIHDWLRHERGVEADMIGVELRPDLVRLCNTAIAKLGLQGLRIEQGDVRSWQPQALNVMIALHACDIATDHAIDLGIRGGADIILCSPCCHKQIRPQLLQPHPLRPILQHGVHLGQEAEMLTDGLRALLLESRGYDTQVFEFISLEHTNKNKMILAVKRARPKPVEPVLQQIAEVKAFFGIREHCLETLLGTSAPV